MLKSFEVRNFRLFRHLEVGRLGRVNLIVGKNNAGKSTFLEALELYASNTSPTILLDLVESRQENWFSEAQPYPKNFFAHPVRHLFFNHRLPRIGEEGITLGDIVSSKKLHIGVA
ncbi:MAG: AAA family ATPase, partial [Scytonema sp. PMC 1069.18]|nr:AAA family ATPase [Scytonema sp. PMC 1069.18]